VSLFLELSDASTVIVIAEKMSRRCWLSRPGPLTGVFTVIREFRNSLIDGLIHFLSSPATGRDFTSPAQVPEQ
jgi:hypothetical protein